MTKTKLSMTNQIKMTPPFFEGVNQLSNSGMQLILLLLK